MAFKGKEQEETTIYAYFPGVDQPRLKLPDGKILVPDRGNPLKPQRITGWKLVDAPPLEPDFIAPPWLESETLLTLDEYRDLQVRRSQQTRIYNSQPNGDKDDKI